MLTKTIYDSAVKRYNSIMESIGYEHSTIGTSYSENTDNWNLRDMVAEMDYVYSCYFESGHMNCEMRYSDYPDERRMWRNETSRIKRFIERFEPYVNGMICTTGHCSRFDN